jgi:fluoride exporter
MSAATWIGVAVLGGVGAVARLLLEDLVSSRVAVAFPLGTLAVNLSGAFALGLLTGMALTGQALVLAGGAAIGSYTTFSTWMLETHNMRTDGRGRAAAMNVVLSVALGVGATALGRAIGAT